MSKCDFKINLFTTLGCHLCEQALDMLQAYKASHYEASQNQFVIDLIEITDSEKLVEEYGVRIPVLKHSMTGEELAWPFDQVQLGLFLQNT